MENIQRLIDSCKKAGIILSQDIAARIDLFIGKMLEWNQKINLTRLTDIEDIINKHIIDSLLVTKYIEISSDTSLIDVGTGAGFPGVPIQIYRQNPVVLVDSLRKRISYLESIKDEVGFQAEIIHARAEDLGKKADFREKFDVATARAVASLKILLEYCLPLVKVNGYFVALKGPNVTAEIEEAEFMLKELGGKITEIINYNLPSGDKRAIILINKISQTPTKYPRVTNKILK